MKPDMLTVISEGEFFSNGLPAGCSAKQRARKWKEAGADLVLSLPVSSALGGYGKKDFATVALIQKLYSAERVILLCCPLPGQTVTECAALLRRCGMLMFRESPEYRERLRENLRLRKSFSDAQMDAVIHCIPDAEKLLGFPENRRSVSILDAMLQLYYLVPVDFIEISPDAKAEKTSDDRLRTFESHAAERLKALLKNRPENYLMNISGSTEKTVNRILDLSEEIGEKNCFREIVELAAPLFPSTDMARLFFLRALLNIRHSDMLMSGLHTYVPYCHLLEEQEHKHEEIRHVKEMSWVPFMGTSPSGQSLHGDAVTEILLAMDQKAEELFQE